MDSIPHPHSLSTTLDRINERHFLGTSFDRTEAGRTLDWLAGRFGDYARHLDEGIGVLASHEDGAGTWRWFPFYYTLLALSEVDTPNARRAVAYALPECDRRLKSIRQNPPFGVRRYGLLSRSLEKTLHKSNWDDGLDANRNTR